MDLCLNTQLEATGGDSLNVRHLRRLCCYWTGARGGRDRCCT